jgi:hypothetical protein
VFPSFQERGMSSSKVTRAELRGTMMRELGEALEHRQFAIAAHRV